MANVRNDVRLELPCKHCGEMVSIYMQTAALDGGSTVVLHDGCDKPTVSMMTANPRKLGMVTGTT